MTTAVLLATAAGEDGDPAALLRLDAGTVVSSLAEQLREHGVTHVRLLTRPEWAERMDGAVRGAEVTTVTSLAQALDAVAAVADKARGTVLVANAEIVTHGSVIAGLMADPRVPSGVVSSGRQLHDQRCLRMRTDRGRVVAAESAYHAIGKHTGFFLQMLKLSPADVGLLRDVARELADLCREQLPPKWEPELAAKVEVWGAQFFRRTGELTLAYQLQREAGSAKWLPDPDRIRRNVDERFRAEVLHPAAAASEDAVSLLLVGLTRRGAVLTSTYLRDLYWARPFTQQWADRAAADRTAINEDRSLLNSAVKASDGFFTTHFVSPYSKYIARWCARRGYTPNQVTVVSLLMGAVSAAVFATGSRLGLVLGAILLQVSFTTDCVDGQLARYTRQFSKLGAWLDSVFDRSKEYMVFAGLAFGATRTGADASIWLLAGAVLALQTFRHSVDFGYAAAAHQSITKTRQSPLTEPDERSLAKRKAAGPVGDVQPAVEDIAGEDDGADAVPRRADGALAGLGWAGVMASRYFEQRPWMKWAKRIAVLPIGERFALISLTAAFAGPRTTFVALLVWGCFAAAYTVTGRVLRSLT